MESYLYCYYLLVYCFSQKGGDTLSALLNDMDPELWGKGVPINTELLENWFHFVNGIKVSQNNIAHLAASFAEGCYLECFEDNISDSLTPITKDEIPLSAIAVIKENITRMYNAFDYTQYDKE